MTEFLAENQQETEALAIQMAQNIAIGDIILLQGALGSGKSLFARAFIRALTHYKDDIPSPTFTLVQTYDSPLCTLWHVDLYRIEQEEEIWELGLLEAFQSAICLIEWPEKIIPFLPENYYSLTFKTGKTKTQRLINVEKYNEE